MHRNLVDAIAITDHVCGRTVFRKCLHDLLGGPSRGGMLGDVEVKKTASVVGQDEEDVEDAEGDGRHGEEVNRCQRPDVVLEEDRHVCEGGLRGLGGMKRETLRSPMSMPSLSNSPWILGAPQPTLASAIWRMSALTPGETSF